MLSALLTAVVVVFAQAGPAAPLAQAPPPEAATAGNTISPLIVTPEVIPSKRRQVDKTEFVCRNELPVGTRFVKKVCATRGEFEERTQLNRELVRDWQRTPISSH